jgi:calcineurin-like phosphoesterase family protein
MIFFTSDTHFYHAKMVEHRGFQSIDDMHEAMVYSWNEVVTPEDTIYHLGDVSFAGFSNTQKIFSRLNGFVRVVPGNHDSVNMLHKLSTRHAPVEVLLPIHKLKVGTPLADGTTDVQRIILCHFPLRVWDQAHYGAWHLHGHSHGHLEPVGRMLDVGVDGPLTCDLRPISLRVVKAFMGTRAFQKHDQHEEKV